MGRFPVNSQTLAIKKSRSWLNQPGEPTIGDRHCKLFSDQFGAVNPT
jgi:hypothetical protein